MDIILRACARAVTALDSAVGEIEGYIFIYGSADRRDAYGTYVDPARPPELGISNGMHRRPIMYEHAGDTGISKEIVGVIDDVWFDEIGIAYRGHLDKSSPCYERVLDEVRSGKLATSSATMPHTAEFHEDGAFRTWILGELSLTQAPAEPRMPKTVLVRSSDDPARDAPNTDDEADQTTDEPVHEERSMDELMNMLKPLVDQFGLDAVVGALEGLQQPAAVEERAAGESAAAGEAPMDARSLVAAVTAKLTAQAKPADNGVAALATQLEALTRSVAALQSAPPPAEVRRTAAGPAISVSEPEKIRRHDLGSLMFVQQTLRSAGCQASDELMRSISMRAVKEVESQKGTFADHAVRSAMPFTRANEVMTSTASGGGDEWVSIAWSSQIWEKARDNRIYQEVMKKGMRVEEIPQGAESIYILGEGSDPTVYTIAQTTDVDATNRGTVNVKTTRPGTIRRLLTPGELGMAVQYSDVFEEDSLLAVASQLSQQMNEKAEETIEQLMINGDTATGANTNINLIDGTPGTGLSTPYYIASDGFLKLALVTGSATSRDGSSLDENDYRLTLKLLPSAVRTRLGQIAFIIDPDTHSASLDIAAVKTEDVRRTNATIVSGLLTNIYGVDVFQSGFMPLANSAGKVPAAGGTLGRILAVYAPHWALGWKRKLTVETARDIFSGTNAIVAKMRIGMQYRATDTAAAVSYNLTV